MATTKRPCMLPGLCRRAWRVGTWGVFTGTSGNDWTFTLMFTCGQEDVFQHGNESRVWAELIIRLSYIFGLRGPVTQSDTASSSSLVAYGLGHTMMRPKIEEQVRTASNARIAEGLTIGVNLKPGAGNLISLSGPHSQGSLLHVRSWCRRIRWRQCCRPHLGGH